VATGFQRQVKLFELNFFKRKTFWSNKAGKIILLTGQFPRYLALNETLETK